MTKYNKETIIKTKRGYIYTDELFEEVVRKIKKASTNGSAEITINRVFEGENGEYFDKITVVDIMEIIEVETTYDDEYGCTNRSFRGVLYDKYRR